MLQVEKKERKGGRKWLIWAILGIAVIAAGIFAWTALRPEPEIEENPDTRGTLTSREATEISSLEIQVRGKDPWTAERGEDGILRVDGPDGWTPDSTLTEQIEETLASLAYEDILTEDPAEYEGRLEEFGLTDPALTAHVRFSDGTEIRFRIGDREAMDEMDVRYMLVEGDPRLFAVAGSVYEDLLVEKALLRPVPKIELQASRIDRITVMDGDGNLLRDWQLEGEITDADAAENWKVTAPVEYPADQDQMSKLRKSVANLRLGLYVEEAREDNLAQYGLENPAVILEVHMAAGTTGQIVDGGAVNVQDREEETFRIALGDNRNEMTVYCLYGNTVYTLSRFSIEAITETDPMETLARYPVAVRTENLGSLEITREDGSRDFYQLTYTSQPAAEEGAEPETVVTCTKNGTEIAYAVFQAAYERLLTVDVSGRLPEDWEKQQSTEIWTFTSLSGRTHRVELSPFDAMHDAVTVDGCTLFYLIKGGMGSDL